MQDKQSTVNYNLFLFPLSVTILFFLSKWGNFSVTLLDVSCVSC